MGWRVILHVILQLVKLCIIAFALSVQGSKGFDKSLYPAFSPAIPPSEEIPGLVHNSSVPISPSDPDGFAISSSPSNLPVHPSPAETPSPAHLAHTGKTIAPSSPAVPNGSFLQPPSALALPLSAPFPQKIIGTEPSISPSPRSTTLPPPHQIAVPSPSTVTSPPQREAHAVWPPLTIQVVSAPTAPSAELPKISPVSQPTQHKSLTPNVHGRNTYKGHTQDPVSPAPFSVSFPNLPRNMPDMQPTEHGSLPPSLHRSNANKGHTPEPISPASVATPPVILPKNSPVIRPTEHGNLPPNIHKRHENKHQTPEPVSPGAHPILQKIILPTLPAPATSPSNAFPVNPPSSSSHPVMSGLSPSIPAPVASPVSNGGAPVAAPLHKALKPLPARIHPPHRAPAAHKAFRQFHHAPESLMAPHKSPFHKQYHFPASSPSTSFGEHNHTRSIITGSAPASSGLVSPPISKHQVSQVPPAPSPSVQISPQPSSVPLIAPIASPPAQSPKTPILPQGQALPPPPPNEDCSSTVCRQPYTNSPPGSPCACVLPMQVGLRFSVSLYTFFPLVSELASEIATGIFMKQSQVRIMGANAANQQLEKTEVMIDLVPLGDKFDNTTAILTSERFWHKQVVINASYFGDYEVLYVIYPGLPPSPPLPPSGITIIDGGPYSNNDNNGRAIKPLGVDVHNMQHRGGLSRGIIAIIALSAFAVVVLCSAAAWVLLLKFREHADQPAPTPRVLPPSLPKTLGTAASLIGGGLSSATSSFRSSIAAYKGSAKAFSMNDIEKATDNFHVSRILGEGGFGRVYSGILEDGTKVAVKVLKREDHHGDREFLAEVEMLSRLHHRNLVKLIGICAENNFRCLVYELIANGSVESHLHGIDKEASPLDWGARMKIALGAARGLAYLHEDSSPRVIHRDFKSSNILLEDDFNPKVSDFGLARTATDEDNRHISTRVMGTFGYVAPEYAMTGHLLVKSDVYSYGVVLLELLTGRKPVDMSQPPGQENLVGWARPLLTSKGGLETIIDPSMGSDVPFDSVAKVAAIASMCVQPEVSNRPFMGEVVQALKLVCNECDEAEKVGSISSSREDLSIDMEMGASIASGQQPYSFQSHYSATNFDSEHDIERGLSASELFRSSARIGRRASGSFRIHSYSGPLRTGRGRRLWQIVRKLSGGSVSEHGTMSNL